MSTRSPLRRNRPATPVTASTLMAISRSVEDSEELGTSMSELSVVPALTGKPTRRTVSSLIDDADVSETQRRGTSTGTMFSADSGV